LTALPTGETNDVLIRHTVVIGTEVALRRADIAPVAMAGDCIVGPATTRRRSIRRFNAILAAE
jgi:hypothetical protein